MRHIVRTTTAALVLIGATIPARSLPNPVPQPVGPVIVTAAAFMYFPGDNSLPQGSLTIHYGTQVMLTSVDYFGNHTMFSYEYDSNGVPFFSSDNQVGPGEATNVSGTASLLPRSNPYYFYCANHPGMGGSLTVIP